MMLANVTALRPRIHEVLAVDGDVLAVVETRATAAGQRILGAIRPPRGGDFCQEGNACQDG